MQHARLRMAPVIRDFRSDNTHGCPPEVLEALARAAAGTATSYGGDEITGRVRERCREMFECDLEIFPVVTGTAGNALAIASMIPAGGTVLCHAEAHIIHDELGAPQFFAGGASLAGLPGANGKLQDLGGQRGDCLSIANATEAGTVYSPDELRAISGGFRVHLDGARFANAVVSGNFTPADLTWRAGVDALVFGGTKNGLMNGELLVVFGKELAREVAPRWHRSGHRVSKMRFVSAQFEAYLADDLWLRSARHANAMARRLAEGMETIHPVDANVVFVRMETRAAEELFAKGFRFFDWPLFGDEAYRLVTGFTTSAADVDAFREAWVSAAAPRRRAQT